MGGFGSGRAGYASTPTDRECLKLDIGEFTEQLNAERDEEEKRPSGVYRWSKDGEQTGEIGYVIEDDPEEFRVKYTVKRGGDDPVEHDYPIRITRTECNFGGTRPWFRCPRCADRVGTLYVPPGEEAFYCRDCHEFGYTTSRASGNTDRTLRIRYNRIRRKLGGEPCHPNSLTAWAPDRPKGMHEETYEDLVDELYRIHDQWDEQVYMAGLRKLTGKPTLDD